MNIDSIHASEIKDSRGKPTIKVTVAVSGGKSTSFSVPSGASTGIYEAHELRDEDKRGVNQAIKNINDIIAPFLVGHDVTDQKGIDNLLIKLDGTKNKDNLGGNSLIGVSIACAKAAASAQNKEVFEYLQTLATISSSRQTPYLFINLINGGKHATNGLAFQEYHIVPNTVDVSEAIEVGMKVQDALAHILKEKYGEASLVLGDEGGFAPPVDDIEIPLALLSEAIKKVNPSFPVQLALDVAASSFFENDSYKIAGKSVSAKELGNIYDALIQKYNIFSIEDPFEEEAFVDFADLLKRNPTLTVVGDDITVTNVTRIKDALAQKSINAMIIKPNQIGTLSETLEAMAYARNNGLELIVSHRSGETMDDFIADLCYAFGCFGLKTGSPYKEERMVKYKRLVNILK